MSGVVARERSSNADTAAFVEALYKAGGFATWTEFAKQAGFQPPQISLWKNGGAAPDGPNLLALIRTAAAASGEDEASLALRIARESFDDQLAQVSARLESLATSVYASLGNQDRGLALLEEILRLVGGDAQQFVARDAPRS